MTPWQLNPEQLYHGRLYHGRLDAGPSWNPVVDLREMWSYPFMLHAYRAGTIVAVLAAVVGYLMVVRRQTFTGHSLAMVGFPGAAGAILLGLSATAGYFAVCLAAALLLAALPRSGSSLGQQSAATGTVQAFLLGCGAVFIALYHGNLAGGYPLLFGTVLGVTSAQVAVLAVVAVVLLAAVAMIGRPLLFATLDPSVAAARGVPVRALSIGYLLVLATTVAAASQITGSLLVFSLLVLPAAGAIRLTARPGRAMTVAVATGLAVTWIGLALAFYTPYPLGFWITTLAFAAFLAATGAGRLSARRVAAGQDARRPPR